MASYQSQVEEAIKLNEQELEHLQEELKGLRSVEKDTPRESYQRQYNQIMRHMTEERAKLEGNRSLLTTIIEEEKQQARNYELASSSIIKLRQLYDLRNKERDFQIRREIDEEIAARSQELHDSINALPADVADELRNSFLNEADNNQDAKSVDGSRDEIEQLENYPKETVASADEDTKSEVKATDEFATDSVTTLEEERIAETQSGNQANTNEETVIQGMGEQNSSDPAATKVFEENATTSQTSKPEQAETFTGNLSDEQERARIEYEEAQAAHKEAIAEMQRIFEEERTRIEEEGPFPTEQQLDTFINDYMSQKIKQNEIIIAAQERMKIAEANLERIRKSEAKTIGEKTIGQKTKTGIESTKEETPSVPLIPQTTGATKGETPSIPAIPETSSATKEETPSVPLIPQTSSATKEETPSIPLIPQTSIATKEETPSVPLIPQTSSATKEKTPSIPLIPQTSSATKGETPSIPLIPQTSSATKGETPSVPLIPQTSSATKEETPSVPLIPQTTSTTKEETPSVPLIPQTSSAKKEETPSVPLIPQTTGATKGETPSIPAIPQTTEATKGETPSVPTKPEETTPPVAPPSDEETKKKEEDESKQKTPPQQKKKNLMEIMDGLTKKLNIKGRDDFIYKATNIKVLKEFKDEVSTGNYLYNIVHLVPAIVKMPFKALKKLCGQKMATSRAKYTAKELQKRLELMPEQDLMTIYNEYYKNDSQRSKFPTILNTLIDERMQKFALERVKGIESRLAEKYNSANRAAEISNAADQYIGRNSLTASEEDLGKVYEKRQEAIKGQAKNIASIRADYKEAERLIRDSNLAENQTSAESIAELEYVSRLISPESEMDEATKEARENLKTAEKQAIAKGDDDKALKSFWALEELNRQAVIDPEATRTFSETKSTRKR